VPALVMTIATKAVMIKGEHHEATIPTAEALSISKCSIMSSIFGDKKATN